VTPQQKLTALIASMTAEVRDAFLAAISAVSDGVIANELAEAIEAGRFDRVFALLNIAAPVFRPVTRALETAFERFADWKSETFPKRVKTPSGSMMFRFDMSNERAERWLKNQSSGLITRIEDETRSNIRNIMTAGMQAGRNPRNVALDIVGRYDSLTGKRVGGIIGLTKNQETWVRSARTKLEQLDDSYFDMKLRDARFDATVQKAIASGKPLPAEIVDKLITRYKDNALKARAENIARSEIALSVNQSEHEATKQAVDSGAIRAQAVTREWDSAGDGRVRPAHKLMDGQRVGLDEAFVAPDGQKLMFPGDASLGASADLTNSCRCRVKTIIDWFDGVE
jgi:uncharacterized protein with gpF-like domain